MSAKKVMIVEDEGIIAMDIRSQLERFGYEVVGTAFSGKQALEMAILRTPDIVMMDIVLKGSMDGISAANAITGSMDIPVIFLTAYSDPDTLQRAKTIGAYGYLIKPFRPDELRSSIEVALYKHQLQRKLKDSEQWFAKTLHCISDAVIATDTEGKVQFMNPIAELLTGQRLTQAEGKSIDQLMTLYTESERKILENSVAKSLQSLAVTDPGTAKVLAAHNGVEIPIDDTAAPILDDNGKLLGAVLVFRDISERREMENQLRESEERFHSAFNLAAIGMALMAIDGNFLQVNMALANMFGYSYGELLASSLKMLTFDDDYDRLLNLHFRQLLADELPSFQREVECQHKAENKIVWVLLSASLVRNAAKEPQYFIVQFQNVSDRKYAEEQLMGYTS